MKKNATAPKKIDKITINDNMTNENGLDLIQIMIQFLSQIALLIKYDVFSVDDAMEYSSKIRKTFYMKIDENIRRFNLLLRD